MWLWPAAAAISGGRMEQNTQKPLGQNPARRAAVRAVVRLHRGGWANLTAKSALAGASLSERDRAFAGALFFGVAERLYTLDYLLAPLLSRPLEKLDVEVRAILEAGLYQLRYMRVPPAAAVDESVKLARAFGKASAAGFVNAVLRRAAGTAVLRDAAGHPAGPDFSRMAFADEEERMRVTYSVGPQVLAAVQQALPEEAEAFLAASFSTGRLCLRPNTLKTSAEQLAEALVQRGAAVWPGGVPGALYASIPGGVLAEGGHDAGLYHVQGEASQYACLCMGAKSGEKVLDICAAPGGKTATLAQYMGGGAGLTACDESEARLARLKENLARLGIQGVQVLKNDAGAYNATLEGQDAVLCDVPCSSLGVMAEKPDIRYGSGEGFAALPALQLKLLRTASRYVKQGGRLVYATCTIRPQENADVVNAFLADAPGFASVPPPAPPKGARVQGGMVSLLPQHTGLDGFFVACLARL